MEEFYAYCSQLESPGREIMQEILQFEADRRVINITINSFHTELSKDDRYKLYPTVGLLYPEGIMRLARTDDQDQVRGVIDSIPVL